MTFAEFFGKFTLAGAIAGALGGVLIGLPALISGALCAGIGALFAICNWHNLTDEE